MYFKTFEEMQNKAPKLYKMLNTLSIGGHGLVRLAALGMSNTLDDNILKKINLAIGAVEEMHEESASYKDTIMPNEDEVMEFFLQVIYHGTIKLDVLKALAAEDPAELLDLINTESSVAIEIVKTRLSDGDYKS